MNKLPLPPLRSDDEAERFVDEADLSRYDLSGGQVMHLSPRPPAGFVNVTVTAPAADLDKARRNAAAEGISLETYLGRLVHDRLEQLA